MAFTINQFTINDASENDTTAWLVLDAKLHAASVLPSIAVTKVVPSPALISPVLPVAQSAADNAANDQLALSCITSAPVDWISNHTQASETNILEFRFQGSTADKFMILFASSTEISVSLPIESTSHILAVNAVPSIFNLILSQPAAMLATLPVSSINNLVLLPIPSKSHSQ